MTGRGQNVGMKIDVPVPVEQLVRDPFVETREPPVVVESMPLDVPGRTIREKVQRLEELCKESGHEIDLPVQHHFARGVYARELFIPKGTVLVGKIHKYSQINVVAKGDISVLTEEGIKRVRAGTTIVSGPGIKRAGYAHEDTIWLTIHGTNETDLDRLEDELIAGSFEEFDALCAPVALGE